MAPPLSFSTEWQEGEKCRANHAKGVEVQDPHLQWRRVTISVQRSVRDATTGGVPMRPTATLMAQAWDGTSRSGGGRRHRQMFVSGDESGRVIALFGRSLLRLAC